jgi:(p)ppGpp synthase/HD superfamily hydrolase
MEYFEVDRLRETVLAPWIHRAMALIGKQRRVGGNQFRHVMGTLAILLDYKIVDPVILKASIIHDLLEDIPETNEYSLRCIDADANQVVDLVIEVSKIGNENKQEFLGRILTKCSDKARILKIADRISNLTDLHRTIFKDDHYLDYIEDTVDYVLPMTDVITGYDDLRTNLKNELVDLVINRLEVRKDTIFSLTQHLMTSIFSRRPRNIYKKLLKYQTLK